ncbi:hypothetical protein RS130_06745 [Paraglaciecola aquimarina]|uniref:DUF2846 domain-containing protein n=1 Tax=Paraglaciecola aquimarina TaxID=1235557 RepID=A0ABU3SUH6_9ALTE|nr:hypothetical protein [Paraglaciecola aquimarina]MDU0353669.1 hypothetical protein [Paraglaciecola aquimarina]
MLTLATGCARTIVPVIESSKQNSAVLSANQGYILFAVQSDSYIEKVNIGGLRPLVYRPKSSGKLDTYILAAVPPGNYYFSSVETGRGEFDSDDEHDWDFKIKANAINYVGNLELLSRYKWCEYCFRVELSNKSSFAIEYLESEHPQLLNQYDLVYQGPGSDNFFEYIKGQINTPMQTQLSDER